MSKYFIIFFLLISSGLIQSANFYVDKTATGVNNGTSWQNAWISFSNINWNLIQPGDVIYISGGSSAKTYFEQMNISAAGTFGNNILIAKGIDSGHNGEVIVDGQNIRQHGINFSADDNYVTVRGLTIKNTQSSAIDMEGGWEGNSGNYIHTNPITGSRIEYCKMYLGNGIGVLVKGTTKCTFYRNYIETVISTSAQTDGYFSQASSFNVWDGDSIIIRNQNISQHCDGIQINQDTSNIVRNCYIEQDNSKRENAQGIYTTESFGTMIYYNNVVNLTKSTSNAIVHRNLSIGNGNVEIYGNVVFAELGADHAIWCTDQNTPPKIKNNILRSLSGLFGTIYITGSNTSQVSNNAITGGLGVGSDVITGNPMFADELGGIFTLLPGSPAIDAGTILSAPFDVDKNGTQRPAGSGWDVGAYEMIFSGSGNYIVVGAGWNYVSIPKLGENMTADFLFPTRTSNVYEYTEIGYQIVNQLQNGKGYAIRFNHSQYIFVDGESVYWPIQVFEGWNLIGPFDENVPISEVTTVPAGIIISNFFEFSGNQFVVSNLLRIGKGYWVKVSSEGILNLNSNTFFKDAGNINHDLEDGVN